MELREHGCSFGATDSKCARDLKRFGGCARLSEGRAGGGARAKKTHPWLQASQRASAGSAGAGANYSQPGRWH